MLFPVFRFREEFAASAGDSFVVLGERNMAYGKSYAVLQFHQTEIKNSRLTGVIPGLIREINVVFCQEQASRTGESLHLDSVIDMLICLWNVAPLVSKKAYPFKGLQQRLPKYAPLVCDIIKMKSNTADYWEFLRQRGLAL